MSSGREIIYSPTAVKDLRKIGSAEAKRIMSKVRQLSADPASLSNNVTALKGSEFSRLRVGDYRVIFTADLTVLTVVKVGHRRDVYE